MRFTSEFTLIELADANDVVLQARDEVNIRERPMLFVLP